MNGLPTDPRYVIRVLFDPGGDVDGSNLLEEDGVTQAKYEADYKYVPAVMERLMLEVPHNIDGFFIVSNIREEPPDNPPSGPVCYNYVLGVQPVTIHKYNADGSMKVNGDKLGRAMKEEIRRVIAENPLGSLRAVRGTRVNVERTGSSLIYGDVMEVLYKQYSSAY